MSYGDRDRDMVQYSGKTKKVRFVDGVIQHCTYTAQGSPAERLSAMNAARSVDRAQLTYEGRPIIEDVFCDLIEQEKIAFGQPFNVQVHIQVF